MKNAVLIIEDYPDESAEGVLVDYDKLPKDFKDLVNKSISTNKTITIDAYEEGLQANYNNIVEIKPDEIIKFLGTANFRHDY